MKKNILCIHLLLYVISGYSQTSKFVYRGRYTPVIKKETLIEAKFLTEIMPEFTRYFILPYNERILFDEQLKQSTSLNANYIYPPEFYNHPLEKYNNIIYFVSIEIEGICHGKSIKAQNNSEILSVEQKEILKTTDPGSDISINIKFKFKNYTNISPDDLAKTKEGKYIVTVVPETEAEFPGGSMQMSEYLNKNIFEKISGKDANKKIQQAIVKFSVNDKGEIIDAKISRSSSDSKIDLLILNTIIKMPKWKPAKNANGITIKQEFNIPFGGGGC